MLDMTTDIAMRRRILRLGWRCGFTLVVCVAAAWLLHWLIATCITLNASWSAPYWGYARIPITLWPFGIERGDWIQFTPPVDAPRPYIKQVRGLPGDMVTVSASREVTVGGQPVGIAKTHSLTGRPVVAIAPGIIPSGHYFVTAPHPDSHDSRYAEIGLIPDTAVMARVWPLPDIPLLGLEGPLITPERLSAESDNGESGARKTDSGRQTQGSIPMNSDITVHPDPDRVFEEAVARGFLSRDPDSADWAGLWMYMFHDAEGRAHFKHRDTRRYRVMPASSHAMTGGGR